MCDPGKSHAQLRWRASIRSTPSGIHCEETFGPAGHQTAKAFRPNTCPKGTRGWCDPSTSQTLCRLGRAMPLRVNARIVSTAKITHAEAIIPKQRLNPVCSVCPTLHTSYPPTCTPPHPTPQDNALDLGPCIKPPPSAPIHPCRLNTCTLSSHPRLHIATVQPQGKPPSNAAACVKGRPTSSPCPLPTA